MIKWGMPFLKPKDGAEDALNTRFWNECAKSNSLAAIVILLMILGMESFMAAIYVIETYFLKQASFFPNYIFLYCSMIVICLVFLILFRFFRRSPTHLMCLEQAMLLVIGIWSAVFSVFDVRYGFSSYLFIQLIVINSLLFKTEPVSHCVINIISYGVYACLILWSHLGLVYTFAELINPFFMVIAACVILVLNYRTKYRSFIDHKLIKEQNRKLKFYAYNDFLTKIPNRQSIIEHLDRIFSCKAKEVACMMIDIDNFKLYNDTYGHIRGDECLIRLAAVINQYVVLHGGWMGRYGGEEFLVLFTGRSKACVLQIAEELVKLAREEKIDFKENAGCEVVTISVGVHFENDTACQDKTALLVWADNALYRAKKEGKNKVCIYEELTV